MHEYIICGDTEEYKECLIYLCGASLDYAEKVLNKVLNSPTEYDKNLTKGYTNIKIKKVVSEDCWWNYGCD